MDRTTLPHAISTIALYTKLNAECNQQASLQDVTNNRPTNVACLSCLVHDTSRAVVKCYKSRVWGKVAEGREVGLPFIFWRYSMSLKRSVGCLDGNLYAKKQLIDTIWHVTDTSIVYMQTDRHTTTAYTTVSQRRTVKKN